MKQAGGTIPSNRHRPEDAFQIREFIHENEQVLIGVVSDGCTGETFAVKQDGFVCLESKIKTDFGAKWIVEKFADQVEDLYKQGIRDNKLVRKALFNLLIAFPAYIPHDPLSCFTNRTGKVISEELAATLYAYIATPTTCTLLLAGNGYLIFNGREYTIEAKGGDAYPYYFLDYPEEHWDKQLNRWFKIFSVPTKLVRKLAICTDGVCEHLRSYIGGKGTNKELGSAIIAINEEHKTRQSLKLTPWRSEAEIREGDRYHHHLYHGPSSDDATYAALINRGPGRLSRAKQDWSNIIREMCEFDIHDELEDQLKQTTSSI